jgi:hypothetical protein
MFGSRRRSNAPIGRLALLLASVAAVLLAASSLAGVAVAAVPDANGVVQACYKVDGKGQLTGDGSLRVIDPAATKPEARACKKDERPVTLGAPKPLQLPAACADAEVAKYSVPLARWVCGQDQDTTYTAGNGLTLSGTTFSADPSAVQSRVTGSCGPGQAIQSIAADGTVSCDAAGSDGRVVGPIVAQVTSESGDRVFVDRGGITIVGRCIPGSAQVVVIRNGSDLNVLSDSRNLHRAQTLGGGGLSIGAANPAVAFDRGEFDIVDTGAGTAVNGSFYAVYLGGSPAACQFDFSALAS